MELTETNRVSFLGDFSGALFFRGRTCCYCSFRGCVELHCLGGEQKSPGNIISLLGSENSQQLIFAEIMTFFQRVTKRTPPRIYTVRTFIYIINISNIYIANIIYLYIPQKSHIYEQLRLTPNQTKISWEMTWKSGCIWFNVS